MKHYHSWVILFWLLIKCLGSAHCTVTPFWLSLQVVFKTAVDFGGKIYNRFLLHKQMSVAVISQPLPQCSCTLVPVFLQDKAVSSQLCASGQFILSHCHTIMYPLPALLFHLPRMQIRKPLGFPCSVLLLHWTPCRFHTATQQWAKKQPSEIISLNATWLCVLLNWWHCTSGGEAHVRCRSPIRPKWLRNITIFLIYSSTPAAKETSPFISEYLFWSFWPLNLQCLVHSSFGPTLITFSFFFLVSTSKLKWL